MKLELIMAILSTWRTWLAGSAIGRAPRPLGRALRQAWGVLREVSGDDAYERYLRHHAGAHPGRAPMSRGEHFEARQAHKWSRVSRCC